MKELHSYTRDLDWHANAHFTIGTRYQSGLDLLAPTTTLDNQLSITGGTLWDEDQQINIFAQTTCRLWYPTATGFIFETAPSSLPYKWNATTSRVQYYNSTSNSLIDLAANQFTCTWVYGINDKDMPIYVLLNPQASAYGTAAAAADIPPPSLVSMYAAAEAKLLYKLIYKGDGQFQAMVDYRNSASLPAGGAATVSAASVTFTPEQNLESTNVQAVLEELDLEKAPVDSPVFTGTVTMAGGRFGVSSMAAAPSSVTAIGSTGEVRFTSEAIYVCIATDTWKRSVLADW